MLKRLCHGSWKALRWLLLLPWRFCLGAGRWFVGQVRAAWWHLCNADYRGIALGIMYAIWFTFLIVASMFGLVFALTMTWNLGPAHMLDLPRIGYLNGLAVAAFIWTGWMVYRLARWCMGDRS